MKRWLIMLAGVLVLALVIGGIWGYGTYKKIAAFKAMGEPKQTVTAMQAQPQQWRRQISAVGTVRAVRGADLSAEVNGIVDSIHFESGDDVKAGALLLDLRAGDDVAKLESLRANASLAEVTLKRTRAELEAQAISQAQLDSASAQFKSAKADVDQQQALVEKKRIKAPFGGHLGIRAVDPGQYLAAGTKVVTLQALDPIHVDFNLPQQNLNALKVGQLVTAQSDTYPNLSFVGRIAAIDPKVDADTRNVMIRATFKNPDHKLLPGMFATVNVDVGEPVSYLTLPKTALAYNPYGETLFVLTRGQVDKSGRDTASQPAPKGDQPQDNEIRAKQVFVTIGPARGDQVSILKGISAGDQIVTSGQLKLKNGTPVVINNNILPSNQPNPKPVEE